MIDYAKLHTADHVTVTDVPVSRIYFRTLLTAIQHLPEVVHAEADLNVIPEDDVPVLLRHIDEIKAGVRALSMKYAVSGRMDGPLKEGLTVDTAESGFPIWQEISAMTTDAATAATDMANLPTAEKLRSQMLREILTKARAPIALQNLMARREYLEMIGRGGFLTPRQAPQARLLPSRQQDADRRQWSVDWAVYDSEHNLPVIYTLDIGDTGRVPMTEDPSVWPVLTHHLLAQSMTTLSPDTIIRGIDKDFSRLHPTDLRRFVIGPFYASAFTVQDGPIQGALTQAGTDAWALVSTLERIQSVAEVQSGLFTRRVVQDFGDMTSQKTLLSPNRVFQSIRDTGKDAFRGAHKHVIGDDGALHARH